MLKRITFLLTVAATIGMTPHSFAQEDTLISGLTEKQLTLGVSLLQKSRGEKNRTLSPYSIHSGLMLARLGAKGETARQLDSVLLASPYSAAAVQAYASLNHMVLAKGETISTTLANSVWITNQGDFTAEFKKITGESFSAEARTIDFTQSEKARGTINAWVSEKTHALIPNLIPSGMITQNTIATLVNALHFKAAWRNAFAVKATKEEDFWVNSSTTIKSPMMHSSESAGYFENDAWQGVNLAYSEGGYTYVLLVPRKRLSVEQVAASLSPSLLRDAHRSNTRAKVTLTLPRHSIREPQNVADSLKELGVVVPFTAEADFSGMSTIPTVIGAVQHESVVIVDEKGTEAAAATAVMMTKLAAILEPESPKEVRADHPFAFAIIHNETYAPLFLGIVGDPR